jgi:hypothetical protein
MEPRNPETLWGALYCSSTCNLVDSVVASHLAISLAGDPEAAIFNGVSERYDSEVGILCWTKSGAKLAAPILIVVFDEVDFVMVL